MASITPYNRKTRSSSLNTEVTPSPTRHRRLGNSDSECRAKRRMVYSDDNPSPAKKSRLESSPMTENSPVKVKAKSFYGRAKGTYLTPLDRKDLEERRRRKSQEESSTEESSDPLTHVRVKPARRPTVIKLQARPQLKSKTPLKEIDQLKSQARPQLKSKPPLKELEEMGCSPLKNKKVELRVYSPSRKNQRFFKSRRNSTGTVKTPSVVQKKRGIQVTYQPRGISTKTKNSSEKPPSLLASKFVVPNLRKIPKGNSNTDDPASPQVLRRSPRKTPTARRVIDSTKTPNSPDLFSPSDWDFGEDDDQDFCPLDTVEEPTDTDTIDSGEIGDIESLSESLEVNCSQNDKMNSSEPNSELSSAHSSPNSKTENVVPTTKGRKVYDIFDMTRARTKSDSSLQLTAKSPHVSIGSRRSRRLKTTKDGKEQMILDLGQKLRGAVQCASCGMTYHDGEPNDEATHEKYHNKVIYAALKFPGWKKENVLQKFADGCRIIVVMGNEKIPMKKVMTVKNIVDKELGFVVETNIIDSMTKFFLFITPEQRIVGFCMAESISNAFRVIAEDPATPHSSEKPWCCSTVPEKACCGINRIWVQGQERRRQVATKLLDCIRTNFLLGCPLEKRNLAFTDPTPDGRKLATKYTGTPSFLVYKH